MKNRYDALSPRAVQYIPGFSPYSSLAPAPLQGISATHLNMNKSNSGCSGNTCQSNPGVIATQSSASENHISQRFLPDGNLNFSQEMYGMPAPPAVYPRGPYYYQDSPLRESSRVNEALRLASGSPGSPPPLNFSVANDSNAVTALVEAPVRRRDMTTTTTIVISTQTLEIAAIIGGALLLLLVGFAIKGLLDLLFE